MAAKKKIKTRVDRSVACDAIRRRAVLRKAAGLWKDRDDLPDFRKLRAEWDRT